MNLNKNTPKSKSLLFAQKLQDIIENNSNLLSGNDNLIRLERNTFPGLSIDEFVDMLRTLDRRNVIRFENEDDLLGLSYGGEDFIWIYVYKENLYKFINLASENLYGLDLENKEKIIGVLKKLDSLIYAKHKKDNQIEIVELKEGEFFGEKDIKIIEWIADYSGFIKIIYELDADFDYDELGRYRPVGASELPKKVEIVDIDGLKQLYEKLKKEYLRLEEKEIKLIDVKKDIEWRCAKCSRFLDRLKNKEQVESYLMDFIIGKYKVCYNCRARNNRNVNNKGEIVLSMLPKNRKEDHKNT